MSDIIFVDQPLVVTLTAKDNDGDTISLAGKTVHFLTRDPDGNESSDTGPTISTPANGQVEHTYVVDTLAEEGTWLAKLLVDNVPSTRYAFKVGPKWDK